MDLLCGSHFYVFLVVLQVELSGWAVSLKGSVVINYVTSTNLVALEETVFSPLI